MDEIRFKIRRIDESELEARWPTDEELKKRQKARVIITRDLGRGKSETDVLGGEQADLDLLREITGRDDLSDRDEAVLLMRNLVHAKVLGIERAGDNFEVKLQCFLGDRTFLVKRPSSAQIKRADGIVRSINAPHNATEIRVNLDLSAEIFNELCDAKDTSIVFKHEITRAMVQELNRLLEPTERP